MGRTIVTIAIEDGLENMGGGFVRSVLTAWRLGSSAAGAFAASFNHKPRMNHFLLYSVTF